MNKKLAIQIFGLFTSISTLLCCALPALLVAIGAGAILASIVSISPWLITLSKYKIYLFSISAFILICVTIIRYKNKNISCPSDKEKADLCKKLKIISDIIYFSSLIIFAIGFFFAFIATYILI